MPSLSAPSSDVLEIGDQFYIRAQSSLADNRNHVLAYGDSFAVFDQHGDIQPYLAVDQGMFYKDTRYLSKLELRICGVRPLLLSSTVRDDNILLAVDLTNPDLVLPSGVPASRGTV
ncbi:MAG TPA: glycogen debranching N-terminal domain-containing protein, partial [Bryobacteraceae bacterium]